MGDELDEGRTADKTPTLIFDVSDLENPTFLDTHESSAAAIDHNMYVKDGLVYQSNYAAGLRVLDTRNAAKGKLSEVAFFDTFPEHDDPNSSAPGRTTRTSRPARSRSAASTRACSSSRCRSRCWLSTPARSRPRRRARAGLGRG